MKKQIILLFFIAATFFAGAQDYKHIDVKHQYKFYKSYEDYKADKPVDGIKCTKWDSWSNRVEYNENGAQQKAKPSKLPYLWFCNEEGMLMRVFDGDLFYVVVDGPISFYIDASKGTVSKLENGNCIINGVSVNVDYMILGASPSTWSLDYYSLTPNGPIKELKNKFLDEYLEKYNLTSQYEKDTQYKKEAKDCVDCWSNKKTNKKIKYIKLINEKMK